MSKRSKHESGSSSSGSGKGDTRVTLIEQKLHELQTFTYDLLVKNNGRKEGTVRSTRAFADPLLNTEIKLLRQRETDLTHRVAELEWSLRSANLGPQHETASADEMRRLRLEGEELRAQLGDMTAQTRLQQLDLKDKVIEKLTRALAESKREVAEGEKAREALTAQVFLLQRQVQKLNKADAMAASGTADEEFDDFFNEVKGQAASKMEEE